MRDANIRASGALRALYRSAAGGHCDDHTRRFLPALPGDGRRALWPGESRMAGVVPSAGIANSNPGSPPGGWQYASRRGRSDGGPIGTPGGGQYFGGLAFDQLVGSDGYAWWYLDAVSEDEGHGVTVIAFIGSVFSPYYAWARSRSAASPLNHCAMNVALYGPRGKCWAMTERPRRYLRRNSLSLMIGPSVMSWDGNILKVEIDEVTAPFPSRIRGTVRLFPATVSGEQMALDADGRHQWRPVAPCSRVEVDFEHPAIHWSGQGYLDSNHGGAPLEDAFSGWNWSRAKIGHATVVTYDIACRDGGNRSIAMSFAPGGRIDSFEPPPLRKLPATGWRLPRETRADAAYQPRVRRTLEDAPFYSRSLLSTRMMGTETTAIHESLSLDRFKSGLVKAMLPFRMPRWPL